MAGITCDFEMEMLILTMYLKKYLKVFENVKYFKKKYFNAITSTKKSI